MMRNLPARIVIVAVLTAGGWHHACPADEALSAEARLARLEALVTTLQDENTRLNREMETLRKAEPQAEIQPQSANPLDVKTQLGDVHIGVGATTVVQGIVTGRRDNTYRNDPDRDGDNEYSDRADATMTYDLEIQAPVGNRGLAYSLIEAGHGSGLDASLDTWTGSNGDIDDDADLRLTELWYQHTFLDDSLMVRMGLLDPTNTFDTNAFANDETTQFLSNGFINATNMYWGYDDDADTWTCDNAFGMEIEWRPVDLVSFSLGGYDGDADFDDVARDALGIAEVGLHPVLAGLRGNYRFGGWASNEVALERWADAEDDRTGWGLYASLDQELGRYLGVWARYSYAAEDYYMLQHAWSAGVSVFGRLWGRDHDEFAVGFGHTYLSDEYEQAVLGGGFENHGEMHAEAYYRLHINDHVSVSPDVQMIWNARNNDKADRITIVGARAQVDF